MRLSGGPNRAFPTTGRLQHPESGGSSVPGRVAPVLVNVPDGSDLLAAGDSRVVRQFVSMKVVKVQCDIPESCQAYLEFDGRRIHTTDDGQGNVGTIELGDMAAGIGLEIRRIDANLFNGDTASRNVRYFIQGLPL